MTDTSTAVAPARVVQRDGWDERDYADTLDELPPFDDAHRTIAETSPVGGDLVGDMFAALLKPAPRLEDRIPPSHAVNQRIVSELLGADRYNELRQYTLGDRVGAGLGVAALTGFVRELHDRLGDVQDAADTAQAAQDRAEQMLDELLAGEGADDEGGLSADAQATLDELRQEAQTAADDVDALLDQQGPAIGRVVRQGLQHAVDNAAEERAQCAAWGTSPGELALKDPAERLALGQLLSTDRTRRIAEQFGRLRNLHWGSTEKRFDRLPEEVFDVTLSDDIAHLLPSDMLGLVDDDLFDDWLRRYTERGLATYELRGVVRKGRGAVIYCGDGSSSMEGARDEATKGLGLALLGVAKDERRAFHAIDFGGPGRIKEWHFECPADFVTDRMLDYAGTFLRDGGTCFVTPLDRSVALLEAEHAATGKVDSSIVFVTDGKAEITGPWLQGFLEAHDRLGFTVYGISVGHPVAPALAAVSDYVAEITDFATADKAIADVFRKVA